MIDHDTRILCSVSLLHQIMNGFSVVPRIEVFNFGTHAQEILNSCCKAIRTQVRGESPLQSSNLQIKSSHLRGSEPGSRTFCDR